MKGCDGQERHKTVKKQMGTTNLRGRNRHNRWLYFQEKICDDDDNNSVLDKVEIFFWTTEVLPVCNGSSPRNRSLMVFVADMFV